MSREKKLGLIAIIVTVIIWGISFINIKVAVDVISPMMLGLMRFTIATVLLAIVVFSKKDREKVKREDLPMLFVAGAVGITVYFYFENNGIKYTSASGASLVIASLPVFTVLAESILFKKKITGVKLASLLLSVVGVMMIIGLDIEELMGSGYGKGYLMMVGAVIAWIAYAMSTKTLFDKYSQLTILFYQSLIGALCFLPFAFMEPTHWELLNKNIMMHVIILGVFASAVGFYLYLYALDKLGVGESTIFLNLIPVVTVVFSIFYLGETVSLIQIAGGALVMASVFMINKSDAEVETDSETKAIVER